MKTLLAAITIGIINFGLAVEPVAAPLHLGAPHPDRADFPNVLEIPVEPPVEPPVGQSGGVFVKILVAEFETNGGIVGFVLEEGKLKRGQRWWRLLFTMADPNKEMESFRSVIKKFLEWTDVALENKVTNYKKDIGTFTRIGRQCSAVFAVDEAGRAKCELSGLENGKASLEPAEASYLLFAISSLDKAIQIYRQSKGTQKSSEKKQDSLFK